MIMSGIFLFQTNLAGFDIPPYKCAVESAGICNSIALIFNVSNTIKIRHISATLATVHLGDLTRIGPR